MIKHLTLRNSTVKCNKIFKTKYDTMTVNNGDAEKLHLCYKDSSKSIGNCWIDTNHIKLHVILLDPFHFNLEVLTEIIQPYTIINS